MIQYWVTKYLPMTTRKKEHKAAFVTSHLLRRKYYGGALKR